MRKLKLSTKPIFVDIENVNRTKIELFFPIKYKKENEAKKELMIRMLKVVNKKYPNHTNFCNKISELYIMNYNISTLFYYDTDFLVFTLEIPSVNIIDDFDLEKAIQFFYDCIFNASTKDNHFEEEQFTWEKEFILQKNDKYPHSIEDYIYDEYQKFSDPKEITGLHHDTYIHLLEEANSSNTYDFYKENILHNHYITYIYGNLKNKEELSRLHQKYFKQEKEYFTVNINYLNFIYDKKYDEKEIISTYNQSVLKLGYQVRDMKEEDMLAFNMLYFMLASTENDLIYNNLRSKNNLIYSAYTQRKNIFSIIDITVFLNKEDKNKVLEIIHQTFESLKDKKLFEKSKEKTLKAIKYDIYSEEDRPFSMMKEIIEKQVGWNISLKELFTNLEKLTYYDFAKFLDKVELKKRLFIKGGDNHE